MSATDYPTPEYEETPIEYEEPSAEFYEEPVPMVVVEEEPLVEIERGLGFTDGFQFGCGFWVAGLVTAAIFGIMFLLLTFLLSFAGINLLG